MKKISTRTLERLILYRKILGRLLYDGTPNIFSRRLADIAGARPEQVRSDLMVIGYQGNPAHGYDVADLEMSIGYFLDDPNGINLAILGLGRMGLAILEYAYWNYPNMYDLIAFDKDPSGVKESDKICPVYDLAEMQIKLPKHNIDLAIITPELDEPQQTADKAVEAGVLSVINFSAVQLTLPKEIYLEDMDLSGRLTKMNFLINQNDDEKQTPADI